MNCRMCNREIYNPTSVQHSIGPVCWTKLQATDYEQRPASLRITITDEIEAERSLALIRHLFTSVKKTCRCDRPLNAANIQYHDHEGGYALDGFGKPQWLYHHCPECKYDYSLWKLGILEISWKHGKPDLTVIEYAEACQGRAFNQVPPKMRTEGSV